MVMKKIERFIVYGVLIALFAIAIPFDYKISAGLYHPNNIIGRIFEILGEVPAYLVATFGAALVALYHPKPSREVHWTLSWFFMLAAVGIAGYSGWHTAGLISRNFMPGMGTMMKLVFTGAVAVIVFGVALFFAITVGKDQEREGFTFGLYLVLTIGVTVLLMQGLKMLWLRPRFRTLAALNETGMIDSIEAFWLPFYHPQFFTSFSKYQAGGAYGFTTLGINETMKILGISKWSMEEFYSFPSGHTMNTVACISLMGLPAVFPALREKKKFPDIFRYCMYGYAAIVAFTRVLRGAHCATDVLAAFLIGTVIVDLGWTFFYQRFLVKRVVKPGPFIAAW